MSHPFQSMLKEYKFAIDHLVPTVPEAIKDEAQRLYEELSGDEDVDEKKIRAALVKIGLAEYPHRHAYHDLTDQGADKKTTEYILEHVDESVRAKIEAHFKEGVTFTEYLKSELFEKELTADERFQLEHGMVDAKDHIQQDLSEEIDERMQKDYDWLMAKYTRERDAIWQKIDELEAMKDKDPKWKAEILETVKRLREGFSVVERDVSLEEVKKEIEYWQGTLGELD